MAVRNNPFKPITDAIPAPFKNKYFLVITILAAWMIFFDKHDILTMWHLEQTQNELEADKLYYKAKIREAHEDRVDIENNKEKYAREKYFLQKGDEEVFIMVDPKEN